MFLFCKKEFFCCYSYNPIKVLESPGISLKIWEYSWDFDTKSSGKSEKALESPGICMSCFGGNHVLSKQISCILTNLFNHFKWLLSGMPKMIQSSMPAIFQDIKLIF